MQRNLHKFLMHKTCLMNVGSYCLARGSLIGFATSACDVAMLAGNTVTATVGSESITIIGVPAMTRCNNWSLMVHTIALKGKLVTY